MTDQKTKRQLTAQPRASRAQRRLDRSRYDNRTHTPQDRAKREQRRELSLPSGSKARSTFAFWLSDLSPACPAVPPPARPYALGRQYARRFLAHVTQVVG